MYRVLVSENGRFFVGDPEKFRSLKSAERYGTKLIDITPVNISSTVIREMIEEGESVSSFIPTKVLEFIEQHRLYKK